MKGACSVVAVMTFAAFGAEAQEPAQSPTRITFDVAHDGRYPSFGERPYRRCQRSLVS